jgi:hypothetical protein
VASNSLAIPTMPIPGKWGLTLARGHAIIVLAAPHISTRVSGPCVGFLMHVQELMTS